MTKVTCCYDSDDLALDGGDQVLDGGMHLVHVLVGRLADMLLETGQQKVRHIVIVCGCKMLVEDVVK